MELRRMTPEERVLWYGTVFADAFPPEERKPLSDMEALIAAGQYEPLGLFDGGALVGFATLWSRPETAGYVLLDYLGVAAARRNGGLGGHILDRLAGRLAGRILIAEAELPVGDGPEDALRRRRIGFYLRHGFQCAYESAGCGLRLQVLTLGGPPADLGALMAAHRAIYGPARTDIVIPLPPGETPPGSLFV